MAVNGVVSHSIDNTVDVDFILYQIGKSGCITKFEVGNLPPIQSKLLVTFVGKIAIHFFRVDVINVIFRLNRSSAFVNNRRLAHAEGIDKHPCRHSQRCKNPAHLQLFGFGTGSFAAPFIAVISVRHMQIPLSVLSSSICLTFWLSKGKSLSPGDTFLQERRLREPP